MRQGLAEKRQAIVRGARRVFGRDGYTRAAVDSIAEEAGVSSRTIYNHFPEGKAQLFRVVVVEGSEEVVRALHDAVDRRLHKVTDLEADLVAFAHAWTSPMHLYPDHFAVVRQLRAEVGHIPQEFLDAWRASGPDRALEEVAVRFRELSEEGLLDAPDPRRAATHFLQLAVGELSDRTYQGAVPVTDEERDELIASGVRAFLRGYERR
ncbi:TetR/AcrR family transcriptional regulator [Streptomyces sp. Qhu-G9]|uniref:TetR/AcrR family transcriptional regulator n=1 Tax=Streptomyces sp. Qhu-G9 TaxID=3452799 RepID=UPI0022AC5676|nr:TetR/AcrR family transcriptional regulator [Streptomyces aurantiacus]WAU84728.1 TetR/AcrR family transcriptional regulator [Streptomyces aurantiacus]